MLFFRFAPKKRPPCGGLNYLSLSYIFPIAHAGNSCSSLMMSTIIGVLHATIASITTLSNDRSPTIRR